MKKRIVIVGAGFVGLYAARLLRKKLHSDTHEIALVDAKDHFLFTPRLIDFLQSGTETFLRAPLAATAKKMGIRFIQADVVRVDREKKQVFLSKDAPPSLPYDELVLCQGAKPCYYGIEGAHEHSFPLKIAQDVVDIHKRLMEILEQARQGKRMVVNVIGAGPSGVEALCAMRDFVRASDAQTKTPALANIEFGLIQAAPQILPGFPLKVVAGAADTLRRMGVRISLAEPVVKVERDAVLTTRWRIPSDLTVWTAGIEPCPITIEPNVVHERSGYLTVDHFLRLDERVFAAGDVVLYREGNVTIPKNAQTAMMMARVLAQNVCASLEGKKLIPFHFVSKGNLLLLGETGYIDFRIGSVKTRWTCWVRDRLYRHRFKQIVP